MTDTVKVHPPVVSREQWLSARKELLEAEKQLTRQYDRVAAQRRRLPMVKLDKEYTFDTPAGRQTLADLFDGKRQLIVYHFMFDPAWEVGCDGCTGLVDAMGDLSMLGKRDTAFTLISRAPLTKLQAYKAAKGWQFPWVSSHGSDFNYDFHATLDRRVVPPEYNYRDLSHKITDNKSREAHGLSVFFQQDGVLHHSYSTYARGCEKLTDAYSLLDVTPFGRQEDFEDSPPGWPQKPTYG